MLVLVVVVAEVEVQRDGGEQLEQVGAFRSQVGRDLEAVDERGLAALGVGAQEVLQLDRRRRIAVRLVGVGDERQVRVGDGVGVGHGADVEHRAPSGRAHLAELLGDEGDRARNGEHVVQDRDAAIAESAHQ